MAEHLARPQAELGPVNPAEWADGDRVRLSSSDGAHAFLLTETIDATGSIEGDFERDATQVRRFIDRHGIAFPVLIAGVADKAKASQQLPVLDRVRSYPTTIFMHADGSIEAIHTGYSGPATGEAYEELKRAFAQHIEAILDE